jgi:glycosyltransferase involved in cell wall biosynthesis
MTESRRHRLPVVSVVVPTYNASRWLGQTLTSLYAQTLDDFEILLIDDASTDDLKNVLEQYFDPRLKVIRLSDNVGVSAARNKGIELALGRYIAFCDADDLCQPMRFQKQVEYLENHPDIDLCGSVFTCFDTSDGETVFNPANDADIRKALMIGNCFGLSTMMIRAPLLKSYCFNSNLKLAEDYELWTRLLSSGACAVNIQESLVRYRLHANQASKQKSLQLDQITRLVRARYCAWQLKDDTFWDAIFTQNTLTLEEFLAAANKVGEHVANASTVSAQDFRFLLAYLYEKLPSHGLKSWRCWLRIQQMLSLRLDRSYRLNTALLAVLPLGGYPWFDVLIKLKR